MHKWWAHRPLAAARAVIFAQLVHDPEDLWRSQNHDTLLLIEPEVAKQYAIEQKKLKVVVPPGSGKIGAADGPTAVVEQGKKPGSSSTTTPKAKSFRGSVEVNATLAKSRLITIADEVIALLVSDPNATICITLEIDAEFANGASDTIKRGVSENAASLGFRPYEWE